MEFTDLPQAINAYSEIRTERLLLQKQLDNLQEQESKLKEDIIRFMQSHDLKSFGASKATVKLQMKEKPQATDWPQVYKFIRDTDSFDLLQRRLTTEAVKLRMEEGIQIPGVIMFPVYDLSISK